jgi:YidC/Oxa1 family membrane protein insertase
MEKRVLVAALLSAVVVVVWFAVLAPPPKPAPPPVVASPEAVRTVVPTPTVAEAPAPPAVRGSDAADIRIEADGIVAVVSPAGGILRSINLPGYKDHEGQMLDLVHQAGLTPLSLDAAGPWNSEPYAVERVGAGVRLRWSDGHGAWVEKRVAPGKGRYALEIEVSSGGAAARAGVVVASGIAKPASTDAGRFAGSDAVVRIAGKLDRVNPAKVEGVQSLRGPVEFAGVEDQYFLLALLPDGVVDDVQVVRVAEQAAPAAPIPQVSVHGANGTVKGTLFAGAKEHRTLGGYGRGLDETISFGWFGFLSVGFLAALRWIQALVGNWGVAIIVLTAGIRVLLFPLNHKSTVAMKRMQAIQPKLKAVQDRYQERAKKDPNVRARMNQEVMQLYKQEGVNPMGGCLPMLVQLPILWALYSLFAYAIELRQAPFVWWIKDLAAKDPTYITPILMTATMVLQQRLAPQTGDPTQRRMFMLMPFIFGFMFISFPSGLVLYWLVNNLFTIGQQLLTERLMARQAAK